MSGTSMMAQSSVASSPASSSSGSTHQRPSADQLAKMVHQMDEENALEFVSIDATSRDQVFHFLHDHPDATAVVNAVGLLTRNYEDARQVNGDVMTNIAAGVFHPKLAQAVQKVVYVSAEPYNLYSRRILGSKHLLKGYFHGKRIGEKAVLENLGNKGVVLRPSFIYGTRHVLVTSAVNPDAVSTLSLPLGWIGLPLDKLLTAIGGGKVLMPPVSVDVVAEAAVRACAWANHPGNDIHGICDVYRMHHICTAVDPSLHEDRKDRMTAAAASEKKIKPKNDT
ncbi:conserved hypothetical protein [Leishmania mexicana MHOM/GT/2001/U1103]|uniref:NAD-dependent epimerase/dehydratase domain-containing protein n=1 Tax=Leishmania mexicana (strain MHOM/GT/2001/U1103) TaxID=929439 RepID=E9APM2_LEIMU|nr:conserved hypothetical protein [Leishmania mexicana MHOM/GT/2001/U1103]CBZ24887.1 conserved hypothetical protein [Leishmania mexicana MHOM/GT/2001/U1103]